MTVTISNPGAPQVPYYIPKQPKRIGTAWAKQPSGNIPKIFQPMQIKDMKLQNRIAISPMCTYSADVDAIPTPFHLMHYGAMAIRGAGLGMTEATSISSGGRSSPNDLGIYTDEQAKKWKEIVDLIHSQDQLFGIQLAHAGRKGSTHANYLAFDLTADESVGGFPDQVVAPSALEYKPGNIVPHALTEAEIHDVVKDFGKATDRAVEIAGFDYLEIHAAHGYLLNNFLSANSNKRTDKYGGSFENRIRIVLEVIDEVKAHAKGRPVFLRISASENVLDDPLAWDIEDSIKLAKIAFEKGVDLIDVSSGGNNPNQYRRGSKQGVHVPLAKAIKEAVGDRGLVGVVGGITEGTYANQLLEDGVVDLVLAGRAFLRNPGLVWAWADELDTKLYQAQQYGWGFYGPRNLNPELYD